MVRGSWVARGSWRAGSAPAGGPHIGCSFRCGSGPVGARWARVQPQLAVRMSAAPSGAGQVRWVLGGLGFSPSWRCACRLLLPVRVGSGRSWWWAGVSPSWRCACPLLLPVDVCVPIVPRSCSAPASGVHIFASVLCSAGMPDLASFSKHYRPMEGLWPVPEYFSCPSPAEVRVDSRG